MKKTVTLAATAGTLAVTIAAAMAHGGATGIVKERMDGMVAMGDVVKSLAAMMRGDVGYDPETVRQGALTIRTHSGEALIQLFPEGSVGAPSEARPEIWTDWDEFTALANRLEVLAEGLAEAADNDPSAPHGPGGSANMMGTGSSTMMGSDSGAGMSGNAMMGSRGALPNLTALAAMPANGVFNMVTQSCSACHTKFRIEKN